MISTINLSLKFGKRALFEDVNIKFTKGNCYGLIGANGAGKSTFLKILSGEIESTQGEVIIDKGARLSILRQNHNEYDEYTAINTVIMGNQELYSIMVEKDSIYAKADFTEEDGIRAGELEARFAELNGWEAEAEAATLLDSLGVDSEQQYKLMKDLPDTKKVKVLLAQALYQNPDILLLDEPTNGLDNLAIHWLEEFLINFDNTVIVISHDRHFLNRICTHIADIDYGKIQIFVGNYDFWYESSQLLLRQKKEENKKKEEKIKELQNFIARFSANASKSKQATSRKKLLDSIVLDELKPSNRKYPYIDFKFEKALGNEILEAKNITKEIDGQKVLNKVTFTVKKGDKIGIIDKNGIAKTALFDIIAGSIKADEGGCVWGKTPIVSYFKKDHEEEFNSDKTILEWLMNYSNEKDETYVRSFLGRMLFSGEEALKKVNVLSGGEKVRCMLSKMMLSNSNFLIFDEPTDHLDLESITSLNNGMANFQGVIIFGTRDYQLMQTTANRIIEITDNGIIDKMMSYDEYLEFKEKQKIQE